MSKTSVHGQCCDDKSVASAPNFIPPQKTKLEKTQSMLTVISTSIGLLGIAGSVFSFAAATFYTGTVQVKADKEIPGIVVKVYTKEGHESVFHSKSVALMPGQYHLAIGSPDGKVIHTDTKVDFNKTSTVAVNFADPAPPASKPPQVKKRWWQFWRHSSNDAAEASETKVEDLE